MILYFISTNWCIKNRFYKKNIFEKFSYICFTPPPFRKWLFRPYFGHSFWSNFFNVKLNSTKKNKTYIVTIGHKGFLEILISGIERSILLWEKMAQNRTDCPKLGGVSEIWNITVLIDLKILSSHCSPSRTMPKIEIHIGSYLVFCSNRDLKGLSSVSYTDVLTYILRKMANL